MYCYNDHNYKIYENVYLLLSLTKAKNKTQIPSKNNKPLSVLFLGIDSMSRMNLLRTMPKTYNYMVTNDWIGLKGYNKIGENTFPNLMGEYYIHSVQDRVWSFGSYACVMSYSTSETFALGTTFSSSSVIFYFTVTGILTGLNESFAYQTCNPRKVGNLDNCDFIWYQYRKLGIITAYGEDEAVLNTFNYDKKGFANPPTDVYMRPYVRAAETLKIVTKKGLKYCTGPVSSAERIFNAAKDFALDVR